MDNGWVKLHRKLTDKGYYKKSQYVHLWVHLLLKANHEGKEFLWNSATTKIEAGQTITGRKSLSEETGIPETTVERILDLFEKESQIGQQKNNKFRLITITNWSKFQQRGQQTDNKRTSSGHLADTNKNYNKEKNDKNIATQSVAVKPPTFNSKGAELIKAFEVVNPACKRFYGNTTQRLACNNLIDTYSFERVLQVIEKTLPKTNLIDYMPIITTPLQLYDKWASLEAQIIKRRSEKKPSDNVIKL